MNEKPKEPKPYTNDHRKGPVFSGELHWNEDPHSVPTPLSGGHGTDDDKLIQMNEKPKEPKTNDHRNGPVYSGELHWNEDPSSVPTPLSGD